MIRDARSTGFWLNAASVTLLIITAARILFVCLSNPVIGYANSYDFVRQSSCVGVWQDYGGRDKTQGNPERPINSLIYDGDRRSQVCLPSSDNLFPWAAAHLHAKRSHMQLREVGLIKAITAIALLAAVVAQPVSAQFRLAMSIAVASVFGDIALLCYWNTLYLEASVIIFAFVGIALAVINYARIRPPGIFFLLLLCGVITWLGFARQQYALFVAVIAAAAAYSYYAKWRKPRSAMAVCVYAASVILGFQIFHGYESEHTRQAEKANLVDTFLGAVLPAAKNPLAAIKVAGLPDTCLDAVGSDWYSPGFQKNNPCPAVYDISRARLLNLFLFDPRTLVAPFAHAIHESRPLFIPYLGHYERPDLSEPRTLRLLVATSFSSFLEIVSPGWYFGLVVCCIVLAPVSTVLAAVTRIARRADTADIGAGLAMIALGGCLVVFALGSAVFGDGYYEMPRHALGVDIGIAFQVAGGLLLSWESVRLTRKSRRIEEDAV
jgi:hypothetical protein